MKHIYTLEDIKERLKRHIKNNYRTKDSYIDDSVKNYAKKMKCSTSFIYNVMSVGNNTGPNDKMLKDLGFKKSNGYVRENYNDCNN